MMRRWSWAALAMLAGVGCAHAPAPPPAPARTAKDYYPLALGNRWTYHVKMLGAERDQTVEIEGERGGFFVDNQGGALRLDGEGLRDHDRYLLKNPIAAGTRWKNIVSVSSAEHYRIVQADTDCAAPAGSFQHCVEVESTNPTARATLINHLTFAPGVGIVRMEVEADVGEQKIPQMQMALTSYAVKP